MAPILDGLRVVEFSHLIAAPLCALTLEDMGAEVIKVEPPEGDYTRTLEPEVAPGISAYFQMLNRGKRGVSVDLRDESARELARRLIDSADVVIESLGEGRSALGTDYDDASSRNACRVESKTTSASSPRSSINRPSRASTTSPTTSAKRDASAAAASSPCSCV